MKHYMMITPLSRNESLSVDVSLLSSRRVVHNIHKPGQCIIHMPSKVHPRVFHARDRSSLPHLGVSLRSRVRGHRYVRGKQPLRFLNSLLPIAPATVCTNQFTHSSQARLPTNSTSKPLPLHQPNHQQPHSQPPSCSASPPPLLAPPATPVSSLR
jgi:hypothetical protein